MKSWFIDYSPEPPVSWREAMPDAAILFRGCSDVGSDVPGVIWLRLASGEKPAEVAAGFRVAPEQRLVVLADEPNEALVVEALATGAAGCCNTHAAPEVLRQVGLVVLNGGLWVGQSLLQRLVGATSRVSGRQEKSAKIDEALAGLSDREAEVARLVASGASNKEVARQLDITERTVKAHLTAIFEKLGLRDRLQLSVRLNGLEA